MVDIFIISVLIAAASVTVGVIFAILELRAVARTRRTDVIFRIYDRFASREIIDAISTITAVGVDSFDDYVKKYGAAGLILVLEIYDQVGILLKDRLVDIEVVEALFGPSLNARFESRIRSYVEGFRRATNEPSFFAHFDYLLDRLKDNKRKAAKA